MKPGEVVALLVISAYPWLLIYAVIWGGWVDIAWLLALGASIAAWVAAEPDPLGETL